LEGDNILGCATVTDAIPNTVQMLKINVFIVCFYKVQTIKKREQYFFAIEVFAYPVTKLSKAHVIHMGVTLYSWLL
jgi:hypothetical protein